MHGFFLHNLLTARSRFPGACRLRGAKFEIKETSGVSGFKVSGLVFRLNLAAWTDAPNASQLDYPKDPCILTSAWPLYVAMES